MWVFPKDNVSMPFLLNQLIKAIEKSRFTARVEEDKLRNRYGIKISNVRLVNRKDNCGAHPGPCLVNRKHRVTHTLEGLDWVGFNALLNDLCDANMLECDIFSFNTESTDNGKYYIRKDRRRRVGYPYAFSGPGNAHWVSGDLDVVLVDNMGKPPPPIGEIADSATPGYPCYSLEEELEYRKNESEESEEEEKPVKRGRSRKAAPLRSATPLLV